MTTTLTHATDIPPVTAADGRRLGVAQRTALLHELERLDASEWPARTECPRWRVREMAAHVVAAAENTAAPLRMVAGMAWGPLRHRGDPPLDAMNELGIDRRREAPAEQILDDLRRVIPLAIAPRWFRPLPLAGGGLRPGTTGATLLEVIVVRDTWLHRHDIARATGRDTLTEPTDAEVVAQVVRDLARDWRGPAIALTLTGPEGGSWRFGRTPTSTTNPSTTNPPNSAETSVSLPAVDYLRHLSGRQVEPTLFDQVPDEMVPALRAARVLF